MNMAVCVGCPQMEGVDTPLNVVQLCLSTVCHCELNGVPQVDTLKEPQCMSEVFQCEHIIGTQ